MWMTCWNDACVDSVEPVCAALIRCGLEVSIKPSFKLRGTRNDTATTDCDMSIRNQCSSLIPHVALHALTTFHVNVANINVESMITTDSLDDLVSSAPTEQGDSPNAGVDMREDKTPI